MTDLVAVRRLLDGALDRIRTVRLSAHHRLDKGAMLRGMARYRSNPHIADWLGRDEGGPAGLDEKTLRIWWQRPDLARQEVYVGTALREALGTNDTVAWQYFPDDRTVHVNRLQGAHTMLLTQDGRGVPAPEIPFVGMLHPLVSELIEPGRLLHELEIELEGSERYLDRDAIRLRGRLPGWGESRRLMHENLPPADHYELIADAETGILLRAASLFEGREFSVREVVELGVGESFPPETFEYPRFRGLKVRARRENPLQRLSSWRRARRLRRHVTRRGR